MGTRKNQFRISRLGISPMRVGSNSSDSPVKTHRARARLLTVAIVIAALLFVGLCEWRLGTTSSRPQSTDASAPHSNFVRKLDAPTNIEVEGSPTFRRRVREALLLLSRKDPENYLMVTRNLQRIIQGDHSGTRVGEIPPTLYLEEETALHSVTWCAGDIVHDAYHHELYRDYLQEHGPTVPVEVYGGKKAEQLCIERQALSLGRLQAPAFEKLWLNLQDGSHYTIPYSNQNW